MTEPLLCVRGLAKRFKAFALEDVSFELPGGLMMGLIGANGAGKTTLIKAILGLVPVQSGALRFKGRDLLTEGAELRRHIAYVPDEPRFVPEMRLDAIKTAHARFFPDWDDARWSQLMAEFGLDPRAKAGTLSMGMKTKFALTLALAREAELLVLDEPTTGLDPVFRRDLLKELRGLIQDESHAILFSTHITSDLEDRADLVTLLHQGHVVFSLDQDSLREQWALVKGAPELLDSETRARFVGLRETPVGFEGLARMEHVNAFKHDALVERPTLEDILVLMGKGNAHVC